LGRVNVDEAINEQRIKSLEETNYNLEQEIKTLLRNPIFKDNTQGIELRKSNK
jgi:hypothetical protein